MSDRADEFRRWWAVTTPLRQAAPLGLVSLGEVADGLANERPGDGRDWVDVLFDRVFDRHVRAIFSHDSRSSRHANQPTSRERTERAFFRYMTGQFALSARYHFVPECEFFRDRLTKFLLSHRGKIGPDEIARARSFYEDCVDMLADKNLLSIDDAATYKEIFPLFEPYYVFYDRDPAPTESSEPLREVAIRLLGPEK